MEDQLTPSPEYLKGFNEGYLMAKDAPAVTDKLGQVKSDSERIQGFHDGRRHYLNERARNLRVEKNHSTSNEKKQKTNDRDMER